MDLENGDFREAYLFGARDAFEACALHMFPTHKHAMLRWLTSLERWAEGPPPPPPRLWAPSD